MRAPMVVMTVCRAKLARTFASQSGSRGVHSSAANPAPFPMPGCKPGAADEDRRARPMPGSDGGETLFRQVRLGRRMQKHLLDPLRLKRRPEQIALHLMAADG